jgi:uncharacterized membrane protein
LLSNQVKTIFGKFFLWITALFYIAAGTNHFVSPNNYINLIPPYLPHPYLLNYVSGILEIISGLLLVFRKSRRFGAILLIIILIAFIPAHIYMIQKNGCVSTTLCVPLWVAWLRLPFQFILMNLAWKAYEWSKPKI